MPNFFTIIIKVEELALGTCVRRINDMPGVVDFKLDLGEGGLGAGRKQLEDAAAKSDRGTQAQQVVKMLMNGPKHLNELAATIGGKKSSFYTATSKLSKEGVVERGSSKGVWQLTSKARAQFGATLALPAPAKPAKAAKGKSAPKGRAVPGSGNIVLRELLADGPKAPIELRNHMAEKGMSPKSISGVLDRARKAALIRKNGAGYELTAKGMKI